MRLIDGGQQVHVSPGIALRKAMASVTKGLDRAAGPVAADQPCYLRPTQTGHLLQVLPQQPPRPTALGGVLPFASTTPSIFWTRWHMSFSFWIRDYVFLPLAVL